MAAAAAAGSARATAAEAGSACLSDGAGGRERAPKRRWGLDVSLPATSPSPTYLQEKEPDPDEIPTIGSWFSLACLRAASRWPQQEDDVSRSWWRTMTAQRPSARWPGSGLCSTKDRILRWCSSSVAMGSVGRGRDRNAKFPSLSVDQARGQGPVCLLGSWARSDCLSLLRLLSVVLAASLRDKDIIGAGHI